MALLDILFLAMIAYLPFSGSLLFDGDLTTATVGLFTGNIAVAGVVLTLIWWLTAHHRELIDSNRSDEELARQGIELASFPVAFAIGCALAFIAPKIGIWAWVLLALPVQRLPLVRPLARHVRRKVKT